MENCRRCGVKAFTMALLSLAACGNGSDTASSRPAPAAPPTKPVEQARPADTAKLVETSLGSTRAKIDVPANWTVTDRSDERRDAWVIENATAVVSQYQLVTCVSFAGSASIDDFARLESTCGSGAVTNKEELPSGAYYVQCPVGGGYKNTSFNAAVVIPRTTKGDSMMHCFTRPEAPKPEQVAIVKSLRSDSSESELAESRNAIAATAMGELLTGEGMDFAIPSSWRSCKTSSECISVSAPCSDQRVHVNRKYQTQASAKWKKACGSGTRITIEPGPPCEKNQCGCDLGCQLGG